MATPNIFLHYWNDSSETITFQEVLAWEIPTPIIEAIQTELLRGISSEQIGKILESQILQRQFEASDIADVVELLLDPRAKSITGQVIHVGGVR